MIKTHKGEKWKEIRFSEGKKSKKYFISNFGRIASSTGKFDEAQLMRTHHMEDGYEVLSMRFGDLNKKIFIHREVARAFLTRPSSAHVYVLHKDYKKKNNALSNLKWATKKEQKAHEVKSPYVLAAIRKRKNNPTLKGQKLTLAKATQLKRKIMDKKRKTSNRQLAEQYGVSEMQIYRIKRGELWRHIKI